MHAVRENRWTGVGLYLYLHWSLQVHRAAQGLRGWVQEQHQEGRVRTRVLQIDRSICRDFGEIFKLVAKEKPVSLMNTF